MRPGTEWYNLIRRPQQAGLAKPSEQSAYFWREAFAFIKERPMDYVNLQIRKSAFFGREGSSDAIRTCISLGATRLC